jgi:hypothetical protein
MSSTYLQRLVDRVAATPLAIASPSGPSRSPLAAADQRLNEPGLADLFSFTSMPVNGGEDAEPNRPADIRPPRRSTPATATARPPTTPAEPELRLPAVTGDPPAHVPITETSRIWIPPHLTPVGQVRTGEFVPSEPAEEAAPQPPPIVRDQPEPERPDRTQPTLVTPPASVAPPLPEPEVAVTPPPPSEPRDARPAPLAREVVPAEATAGAGPETHRPTTAAGASLIGPLTPEPRARTMFGLRRR